jgi:aryl-alcohol dehydrogenase-like predicted oxidoreductase
MDDLVRAGKVLYVGMSDIPAWQASRMQAIAELRGWAPLIALQIPYNLIERTVERDLIPMPRRWGSGSLAGLRWRAGCSPPSTTAPTSITGPDLARAADNPVARRSLPGTGSSPSGGLDIAEVVKDIAAGIGTTPSRVALAWTLLNPAVAAPIVGVRSLAQLDDNLGALQVKLDPGQQAKLDEVSAIELGFPHEALRRLGFTR